MTESEGFLKLPPHYREVIVLCELNGLSYDETAQAIGCRVGTVRSRLNRARRLLIERCRPYLCPTRSAGALATAMLLFVVVNRSSRGFIAVPVPVAHPEVRAQPMLEAPTAAAMFPAVAPRPIAIARAEPEKRPRRVEASSEIVSFVPLSPDVDQALVGSFRVARVLVAREVLADLGVVLDANRLGAPIQADVVFGEDGLARAIRIARQDAGRSQ